MTTLESGTQPASGGTESLTDVIRVFTPIQLAVTSNLSATGFLSFSNTRPIITDVIRVFTPIQLAVTSNLSATGFLSFSNTRPIITGVMATSLPPAAVDSTTPTTPVTRQLLIR